MNLEKYDCLQCSQKFNNRRQLIRHNARVHEKRYAENNKPKTSAYKCEIELCNAIFQTPGALNDHLNKHNGKLYLKIRGLLFFLKIDKTL